MKPTAKFWDHLAEKSDPRTSKIQSFREMVCGDEGDDFVAWNIGILRHNSSSKFRQGIVDDHEKSMKRCEKSIGYLDDP